jgi:uncharacterized membrane protein
MRTFSANFGDFSGVTAQARSAGRILVFFALPTLLPACGARSSLWDGVEAESASGGTRGGAPAEAGAAGAPSAGTGGATPLDSCVPNPCLHGGTCTRLASAVSCTCPGAFVGETCELPRFELLEKPAAACSGLPNAYFVPTDLSGDGKVVVGYCSATFMSNQPPDLAFRWSRADGYVKLLPSGSMTTRTSYDGTVTAGTGTGSDHFGAAQPIPILWRSGAANDLGTAETLTTAKGSAVAVSGDGAFTVGDALGSGATRWRSATSFAVLPVPDGATFCSAADTSGNGSVTLGICDTTRAVIWRDSRVTTTLDPIAGTSSVTELRLSADGAVVVGLARDFVSRNGRSFAFRWTVAGGSEVLDANGDSTSVSDVSGDGAVIVGTRFDSSLVTSERPAVWDRAGRQDLDALLTRAGADLAGWSLETVIAISDDGESVVGVAYTNGNIDDTRPYLAHLPVAH